MQSGDASKQLLLVLFEMKILNYAVVYKQLQETFPTVNLQFFLKVIKDVIIHLLLISLDLLPMGERFLYIFYLSQCHSVGTEASLKPHSLFINGKWGSMFPTSC